MSGRAARTRLRQGVVTGLAVPILRRGAETPPTGHHRRRGGGFHAGNT